jgi:membrane associated rhomboid family serine protease
VSQQRPFRPYLTVAMAVALLGWYLFVTGGGPVDAPTLMRYGARKAMFGFPQPPWRLLSSIFLHAGWFHLISNLLVLLCWGGCLEKLVGRGPWLAVFLLGGLWGSLASDLYGPRILAVGASGAVFSMLSSVLVLSILAADWAGWEGSEQAQRWRNVSVVALALNLVTTLSLPWAMKGARLDHWAHAGGALCGLALMLAPALVPSARRSLAFWLSILVVGGAAAAVIASRGSGPFS